MHVFIDTNVLLSFFGFSKDDLNAVQSVFAAHKDGATTVHVTQQVIDEYYRNRENKIQDAMKRFDDSITLVQIPSFMRDYKELEQLAKLQSEMAKLKSVAKNKAEDEIEEHSLAADKLIDGLFESHDPVAISEAVYTAADRRMKLGNPPGKKDSLGDAVNWEALIAQVPEGADLHVISGDGDFYSKRDKEVEHPFLAREWRKKKNSDLFAYRTLSEFLDEHFKEVKFSYDKEKEALIAKLASSPNFATTHHLIAALEKYTYFSPNEVALIDEIVSSNSQVGAIAEDHDIESFLKRISN
ncbi:PIN domain-containing protein [Hyphomonas sp.]|uniref:PIN domain-containing protein n=1 Tax=Hyphomonas sp. TaxID=87 RepID=UPI003D29278F